MDFSTVEKAWHRKLGEPRRGKSYSFGNAEYCIGELSHGCEIYGFTQGRFSLFDICEVLLAKTGPAKVDIATWTAAGADTKRAKEFIDCGIITGLRFVVDPSFRSRQPDYCRYIDSAFPDSIRTIKTHAKFILVYNNEWNFVVRTSMNLNQNARLENFEISEDYDFRKYISDFVDQIFREVSPDHNYDQSFDFDKKPESDIVDFSAFGLDRDSIFKGVL